MGKLLTGGVIILFIAGMTVTGFLLLQENPELVAGEKPKYTVSSVRMQNDTLAKQYTEFTLTLEVTQGSLSVIGVNHNFLKWELTGDLNKTVKDGNIVVNLQYTGLGSKIKFSDNVEDYFIQLLLSDGNIITWKFNSEIKLDFIP